MASHMILKRLNKDETGATAIEYGLIVGLIVIAMMVGLSSMASANTSLWGEIKEQTKAVMNF